MECRVLRKDFVKNTDIFQMESDARIFILNLKNYFLKSECLKTVLEDARVVHNK